LDSFGQVSSQSSGDAADQPSFIYDGMWAGAAATGLDYDIERWYDAVNSVFASQDPTGFGGGQTNTEEFCGNSPTNFTDPLGLCDCGCPAAENPFAPVGLMGVGGSGGSGGSYTPIWQYLDSTAAAIQDVAESLLSAVADALYGGGGDPNPVVRGGVVFIAATVDPPSPPSEDPTEKPARDTLDNGRKSIQGTFDQNLNKVTNGGQIPKAATPQQLKPGAGLRGQVPVDKVGTQGTSRLPIQHAYQDARGGALEPKCKFNNKHLRLPNEIPGGKGKPIYQEYEIENPGAAKSKSLNDWRLYHDETNDKWYYSVNSHAGGKPGTTPSGRFANFYEIIP
jgi:RHS repeat-associated protein